MTTLTETKKKTPPYALTPMNLTKALSTALLLSSFLIPWMAASSPDSLLFDEFVLPPLEEEVQPSVVPPELPEGYVDLNAQFEKDFPPDASSSQANANLEAPSVDFGLLALFMMALVVVGGAAYLYLKNRKPKEPPRERASESGSTETNSRNRPLQDNLHQRTCPPLDLGSCIARLALRRALALILVFMVAWLGGLSAAASDAESFSASHYPLPLEELASNIPNGNRAVGLTQVLALLRGKDGYLYLVFKHSIRLQGTSQTVGKQFLGYEDTPLKLEAYHVDYPDRPGYSAGSNYDAITKCTVDTSPLPGPTVQFCYLSDDDEVDSCDTRDGECFTSASAPVYIKGRCSRHVTTCGYRSGGNCPFPGQDSFGVWVCPFCDEYGSGNSVICPAGSIPYTTESDGSKKWSTDAQDYKSCFSRDAKYTNVQIMSRPGYYNYDVTAVAVSKNKGRTWTYLGAQRLPQPEDTQIGVITTTSSGSPKVYSAQGAGGGTSFMGAALAPDSGIYIFYESRKLRSKSYSQYDSNFISYCTTTTINGVSYYTRSSTTSDCPLEGLATTEKTWITFELRAMNVTPDGIDDFVVASKLKESSSSMQNLRFVGSGNGKYYFCLSKGTYVSSASTCDSAGPDLYASDGVPKDVTSSDLGGKLSRVGYFGVPPTSGSTYDTILSMLVGPDGSLFARKTGNTALYALRNGVFSKILSLPSSDARTAFDGKGNLAYTYYVGTISSPQVNLYHGVVPATVLSGTDSAPYAADPKLVDSYNRPKRSGTPAYTSHLYPSLYLKPDNAPAILVENETQEVVQYVRNDETWNTSVLFTVEKQLESNTAFIGPTLGQSEDKISLLIPASTNKAESYWKTNACGSSSYTILSQAITNYDLYTVKKSLVPDEPTLANALSELVPFQHYRLELPIQTETAPTVSVEAAPGIVSAQVKKDAQNKWYADVKVEAKNRYSGGLLDVKQVRGTFTVESGELSSDTPLSVPVRHVVREDLAYVAPENLAFYRSDKNAAKKQITLVNNYPRTVTLSCGSLFSESMPANSIKLVDASAQNASCKVAIDGKDTRQTLTLKVQDLPQGDTYWSKKDVLAEQLEKIEEPVTFKDAAGNALYCFQAQQALNAFEELVSTHVEHINAQPGSTVSELYPNGYTEKMVLRTAVFDDLDDNRLGACNVVFGGFDVALEPGQVYEMALKVPRTQNWLAFDSRTISLPTSLLPQWSYATPGGVKSDRDKFIEMIGVPSA
ncbi:hypothetical protein HY572_01160 [Candidatus Micrarchaeota archaeon]|nr:hypothetical protein [Candidatus Micrarchaeota archaeon]